MAHQIYTPRCHLPQQVTSSRHPAAVDVADRPTLICLCRPLKHHQTLLMIQGITLGSARRYAPADSSSMVAKI